MNNKFLPFGFALTIAISTLAPAAMAAPVSGQTPMTQEDKAKPTPVPRPTPKPGPHDGGNDD